MKSRKRKKHSEVWYAIKLDGQHGFAQHNNGDGWAPMLAGSVREIEKYLVNAKAVKVKITEL